MRQYYKIILLFSFIFVLATINPLNNNTTHRPLADDSFHLYAKEAYSNTAVLVQYDYSYSNTPDYYYDYYYNDYYYYPSEPEAEPEPEPVTPPPTVVTPPPNFDNLSQAINNLSEQQIANNEQKSRSNDIQEVNNEIQRARNEEIKRQNDINEDYLKNQKALREKEQEGIKQSQAELFSVVEPGSHW